MKIKALATALMIAGTFGVASTANAQYYDRDYARADFNRDGHVSRYERERYADRYDDRRYDERRYDDRRYDGRYVDRDNVRVERRYYATRRYEPTTRWVAPRGYRSTRWVVGRTLPAGYYGANYYVSDYRGYNLIAPQRGYRWVRVDRDVYLVDLRTGRVADVRYDLFY